eukprot:55887-Eustigmatos_ZCMA.PRE.1
MIHHMSSAQSSLLSCAISMSCCCCDHVSQFVSDGHSFLMAQSFAKNFGLYGERVGTLSAVCASKEEADRVMSQLKILIRPMYSNPPVYGARIVSTVLHGKLQTTTAAR